MGHEAKTKLLNVRDYVVLDTETTGLSPSWCETIEVGILKVKDGEVIDQFQTLIKPKFLPIDEFITELTGITSEMLEDAPLPSDVSDNIVSMIGEEPILGHNVCFDVSFIKALTNKEFKNTLFDTKRIGLHVFPNDKHSLEATIDSCIKDGALIEDVGHHRTIKDCINTYRCYEWMRLKLIDIYGVNPEEGYKEFKKANKAKQPSIKASEIKPTVNDIDESNPFYGTSIAFTGKLETMTRNEAMQNAVNLGATPKTSVGKKLDYLVLGSLDFVSSLKGEKSSKLLKAEELARQGYDIRVIDEKFFTEFLPH